MGMDVYGRNPKQNKPIEAFPTYHKYTMMEKSDEGDNIDGFKQKWKELNGDETLRNQYYTELQEYETVNVGHYFRNNCWWWRPLWNYCHNVAPDLIDEKLFEDGHGNSGAGLDDKGAKKLGQLLLQEINNGNTIRYQAEYHQWIDDLPDDDCIRCNNNNHGHNKKKECTNCDKTGKTKNWNKSYPFDIDNVREFAEFCLQSGGFRIC
tara:strand:+ start:1421 stop:2041 length:621 start_codon:yes stop_codon:yes gene_type:complete